MPAWLAPALIGAAVGFGSSAVQRGEAKSAKRDEDKYLDELLASNQAGWNMNKSLTIAKRDESIRAIKLREANERKFANFKDANNQQAYKQSLAIYEYQHRQANRQYEKSEDLYRDSLSLNARAAENAKEQEINQLMEERQKFAFENEDNILQDLMAAGTLAATGLQGRSAKKAAQAQMASLGRNTAIMTESLISADRNTRSNLKDISRKLDEANTLADARRMLKPEKGPAPLAPLSTPINDYELPRELQDFDFGVTPIRGMSSIQVPSWGSVFANAATSAVSAGFNAYSGSAQSGTQKTTYDYGNR